MSLPKQLSDIFRKWEVESAEMIMEAALEAGLMCQGQHITVFVALTSDALFFPRLGGELGKKYKLLNKAELKVEDYEKMRHWFLNRNQMGGSGSLIRSQKILDIVAFNRNKPVYLYPSIRRATTDLVAAMNKILRQESHIITGVGRFLYIASHEKRHQIWLMGRR